ncbi:MAG: pyridine nucleotide-disulfide oxidoreductase family protein [Flavobacteriales bacterium]|nr:pyridine nucleotide-disulfide oxidoreductase family protein [Flavobacteriales bacterium]
MNKTIVIIGGVAGGATTAARLRRIDENAHIIMIEKGENISYANCGLPYYIGGIIKDRNKLLIQTPQSFGKLFNIDVRIYSEVTDIDTDSKSVTVKNHKDETEYTINYDQLVLSPGAKPIIPPLEGINHKNIYTLRDVNDTDNIKSFIDTQKPKNAVVIGAGFIGLEMAENLHHQGINVSVIEASSQVLNMLDAEMATILHAHFKEKNIGLYLEDKVVSFDDLEDKVKINLESGKSIETDMVILSIGVRPNVDLAKKAGIRIGETGGIWVDKYLQTSKEDVYALGDCIEFPHPDSGKPVITYLAGPANKQGRILADNLTLGHHKKYTGSHGTAIAKVFDLTAAITGASDKALQQANVKYTSTVVTGGSHAGYYPGSQPMTMKISFCPFSGKLYGGQIVGFNSVDKRIDMIATTIQHGGTIYDLQEIEHAYAPPFNSAKDLVNQIGFNAENIIKGFFKPLLPKDILNRDKENTILVDVRTPEEVAQGSIDNAINIPVNEMRNRFNELDKSKKIYLYCGVGLRGYFASRVLAQNGFDVYNLSGGYKLFSTCILEQSNEMEFQENLESSVV